MPDRRNRKISEDHHIEGNIAFILLPLDIGAGENKIKILRDYWIL
jgi:hypothetical protein